MASFEAIVDTINNESRNKIENQVSMFDLMEDKQENIEKQKYLFIEKEEMETRELLSLEKEMLGVYISGHPLDKYRKSIERQSNISTINMMKINEEVETVGEAISYKDGQSVKFIGIISKVKKKFTKKNTTMAFVTVEDFFGSTEIIIFDGVYQKMSHIIVEDNIILIEGRLSIREDEPVKIVASSIKEFSEEERAEEKRNIQLTGIRTLSINITNLTENVRAQLKGAIKFFTGDRTTVKLEIVNNEEKTECRGIFLNDKIYNVFVGIVGKENVELK